ncbi:MAG: ATP-binding protein [Elusimicrobia bacterium]|nr:ATP-binding protein [Elusimicrobiota bacterium]
MLEELFFIHKRVVEGAPLEFKRYLYDQIDWKAQGVCVTGPRGVGKTTLLIQHYHEAYGNPEKCLYLSADNVEVAAFGLFQIAKEYFQYGGEALVIDEIHKHPQWQGELKSIVDTFKNKKIIVSGSSSLALQEGKVDLSRRLAYYALKGLSFREYLSLKEKIVLPVMTLEEIFSRHVALAGQVSSHGPVLKYFKKYLASGYYPFFVEGESTYFGKLLTIVEKALYEDVAAMGNLKRSNILVLKKMLWLIATSSSFTVNIEKMSRDLGLSKIYVYAYLEYLERAGLITCLAPAGKGYVMARKPQKIYIHDPNLLGALHNQLESQNDQGAVRETFFVSQLNGLFKITASDRGDFLLNDRYTIEVGGKDKSFDQVRDTRNGYVAADRMEMGAGKKIPLYLFGMLY